MKFERTERFKRDYRRLPAKHKREFKEAVAAFHSGAERAADGQSSPWDNSLRVKRVEGAPGVWEMTWSWSGPDGRATWEWIEVGGQPAVRWRRIGTHAVFRDP